MNYRWFLSLRSLSRLLAEELQLPANYGIAFIIGLFLNLMDSRAGVIAIPSYLVPFVVLTLGRAIDHLRNQNQERLLLLPAKRRDPAFLMDNHGDILAASGKTKALFDELAITNICQLIGADLCTEIILSLEQSPPDSDIEAYVDKVERWYRIRATKAGSQILVWFSDISEQKDLDQRLGQIHNFNLEIADSLQELVYHNDSYDRLARLILREGYHAVFITRLKEDGHLHGRVFKEQAGIMARSDDIDIDPDSDAAVRKSTMQQQMVSGQRGPSESADEFYDRYRFDPRVRAFIAQPLENFVNYHQGELSIIAFNKTPAISRHDLFAMETMVNTARTVTQLIDLAEANENLFLQAITGLCAAAEFSDEITGTHILRVNEYARLVAGELTRGGNFCRSIGQVAAIHDIGKVAIPHIIKLQRRLDQGEQRKMERHTMIGAQIIDQMLAGNRRPEPRMVMARNIALHHHQRWDGSGYPALLGRSGELADISHSSPINFSELRPLRGEEIPIEGRIVSLADVYDALRSPRPYKPAFSHTKAMTILRKDDRSGKTGEQIFGPDLMAILEKRQDDFAEIYDTLKRDKPLSD